MDEASWNLLLRRLGPSLALWRAAEIAALRRLRYDQPVADLGCGDGMVSSLVLDSIEFGIDPSREALQQARKTGLYKVLMECNAEHAPISPGSLGSVISNSVFEHLATPQSVIQWASCVLRIGGRLIFSVPSDSFSSYLAVPITRYRRWRNRMLEHRNLWPIERWRLLLEQACFKLEQTISYMPRSLVFVWDVLDLMQQLKIRGRRIAGLAWKKLPEKFYSYVAGVCSHLDFSDDAGSGGFVLVARKTGEFR